MLQSNKASVSIRSSVLGLAVGAVEHGEQRAAAAPLHSTASSQAFFVKQGYIEAGNVRSPYGVETIFCWKQIDPAGIASGDPKRKRFCNCNSA